MEVKHAYCFVANSNFSVLETALRMLDDSRNDIFILFDHKSRITKDYKAHLESVLKYSRLRTYEHIVNWGGYTQVSAVLILLKCCVESQTAYEYIHFFQGSDLPIKNQDQIHSFFHRNTGLQFVEVDKKRTTMAAQKCHYRHFLCHNRFFRRSKFVKAVNFSLVFLQRIINIRKNLDIGLYHGSALFSITEDCANYILSRESEIYERFRFALAPDEVFIQTILMDSEYQDRIAGINSEVSCNARLIDRTRPDGKNSPHIWRINEAKYILSQPENICFARKFDANVDEEIVQRIYVAIKGE